MALQSWWILGEGFGRRHSGTCHAGRGWGVTRLGFNNIIRAIVAHRRFPLRGTHRVLGGRAVTILNCNIRNPNRTYGLHSGNFGIVMNRHRNGACSGTITSN